MTRSGMSKAGMGDLSCVILRQALVARLVSIPSEASLVILTMSGTSKAGIDDLSCVILCKALVA